MIVCIGWWAWSQLKASIYSVKFCEHGAVRLKGCFQEQPGEEEEEEKEDDSTIRESGRERGRNTQHIPLQVRLVCTRTPHT